MLTVDAAMILRAFRALAGRGGRRTAAALAGLGVSLLLAGAAAAQGPPFQPPMQPPMGPFGGRGFGPWGASGTGDWVGWFVTLLIVVLLVAAILYLIPRIAERRGTAFPSAGGGRALEILKERYARGEIDRKEFEEKKQNIV
jgi:putative membrane protein